MSIRYEQDEQGVVTLTMDMTGRSANVLDDSFYTALTAALDRLSAAPGVTGVILTSGKTSFVAGADIDTSFTSGDPAVYFRLAEGLKTLLRRLETFNRPVVAALNGTALGAGLELALACHFRVAIDDDQIQLGFPEVGLGLLPGAGGVARTVRLAGLQVGLEWLAQNRKYTPRQALQAGLIHALAVDKSDMLAQARAWIGANPDARAPWDSVKRYKIPGGGPDQPHIAQMLAVAPAVVRQETRGNYPAPPAILAAAVEGAQVDFATACRIESRYFAQLAAGQVSRNMIAAFWTQLKQIKKGRSRPAGFDPQTTRKVGVLGAGMMGHGIACVAALAGMDVVLVDATQDRADGGLAKITAILVRRVQRGRLAQAEMDAVLARIKATAAYDRLSGCDLVD